MSVHITFVGLVLALSLGAGCKGKDGPSRPSEPAPIAPMPQAEQPMDAGSIALAKAPPLAPTPLGLPELPMVDHNPTTTDKVALGRVLFFDPRLSATSTMSCASCHDPENGFGDAQMLSKTAMGQLNQRHTPTLLNVAYHTELFWDGRMPNLEAMILSNWRGQMAAEPEIVAATLARSAEYRAHFERAFGGEVTSARIAESLAAFVRTLRSGDSPWDRYEAGDAQAVSAEAIAGARVFNERAGCATCHVPPLYTDLGYHRILPLTVDPGRALASKREGDRGAFKTPSLRGLVHTAPYFHDGSAATLEAVLATKGHGRIADLSAQERSQLLAFLRALSPEVDDFARPELPGIRAPDVQQLVR